MNVLLTFAGRKSYLVSIFEASSRLGELVAADSDPVAAVRKHTSCFRVVPRACDGEAYIDALVSICREFRIDAVLPQNDLDLVVLAEARPRFAAEGVLVAGVDTHTARLCEDKLEMASWLAAAGFQVPRTALPLSGRIPPGFSFPVVVKSRRGQGSAGFRICRGPRDLENLDGEWIVQELLEGDEFNLDVLGSHGGLIVATVPKRKLSMLWGSTDVAESVDEPGLVELGARIGKLVGCVGSIDIDLITTNCGPVILDINPRMGGGFPFTAEFCQDYVEALLAIMGGETPAPMRGPWSVGRIVHREHRFF